MDAIEALNLGLDALTGSKTGNSAKDRARAGLIRAALDECGFTIVSKEPTEAMLEAGEATFFHTYTGTSTSTPDSVWKAMVKAAR